MGMRLVMIVVWFSGVLVIIGGLLGVAVIII